MDTTAVKDPSVLEPDEQAAGKTRKLLIIGLLLGMFFSSLDQTVVGTAMPTIIGQLGNIELLTWITTAYLLTSTSVVPIAGKLADVFGRRKIYILGMSIFIIGSALCGMADTMLKLAIYRGIQGIGGGMLMPLAMTIIGDITTGANRAKMQGLFMGVFGLSTVFGPQLGGWIVDSMNWHWVFYINLPFGLLALVFIWFGLQEKITAKKVVIDWAGILTLVTSIVTLLLGLSFGGKEYAWGSWQIIVLFSVSAVCLAAFILAETKAKDPILPLHLFKNRVFSVVNVVGFLMSVGMFGALTFIPLFMQGVLGLSASEASSVMTPMMIGVIVTSLAGTPLLGKLGLRLHLLLGLGVMAVGFVLFSLMGLDTTRTIASVYMFICGMGMGLIMPALNIAMQETFPAEMRGTVTASTTFFRSIGGTVGIAALGVLFNNRSVDNIGGQLDPVFTQMGPQGGQLLDMAHNNPQGLFSSLLDPGFLSKMPEQMATLFAQQVMPVLKDALLDALHYVFHFSIAFAIAGMIVALFAGKVKFENLNRKPDKAAKSE